MSLDKKDLDSQVVTLNKIILNVFRNYVPSIYITIDDKDPVWMKQIIKSKNGKKKQAIPAIYSKWKVWKWSSVVTS